MEVASLKRHLKSIPFSSPLNQRQFLPPRWCHIAPSSARQAHPWMPPSSWAQGILRLRYCLTHCPPQQWGWLSLRQRSQTLVFGDGRWAGHSGSTGPCGSPCSVDSVKRKMYVWWLWSYCGHWWPYASYPQGRVHVKVSESHNKDFCLLIVVRPPGDVDRRSHNITGVKDKWAFSLKKLLSKFNL